MAKHQVNLRKLFKENVRQRELLKIFKDELPGKWQGDVLYLNNNQLAFFAGYLFRVIGMGYEEFIEVRRKGGAK